MTTDVHDQGEYVLPARVCPHCATVSHTDGPYCPQCGQSLITDERRLSRTAKGAIAGVILLAVLAAAGSAIAIKVHQDNLHAAQRRAAAARVAAARAAAAQAAAAQQAQQQAEVTMRQGLETQLEQAITKDAQSDVDQGLLTSGPILSTNCTPISGGSSQDLSQSAGTYSCIAIYSNNPDGTSSGYDYSGTINFNSGSETWRLGSTP